MTLKKTFIPMRKINGKDTSRTKVAEKVVKNCCTLYRNSLPLKKNEFTFLYEAKNPRKMLVVGLLSIHISQTKSRKQSGKCAFGSKSNKSQIEDLIALTC